MRGSGHKVALVAVVRVVAGIGSAADWIGITMIGVVAALVIFLGVVLIWVLMAKTEEERRYRLQVLREFLRFLLNLFRGWGKR
jgi:O-antigen/teichoic acid export membrane protein